MSAVDAQPSDVRTSASTRTPAPPRGRSPIRLGARDRITIALMAGIPTLFLLGLVWFPALSSIALSFTRWDGIGGLKTAKWVGFTNYRQIFTIYPPFWPAVRHNIVWLIFLLFIATTFGLFLAVLLDKNVRFSRVYQSAFYMPVILSSAVIGFIWGNLIYSPGQGLLNSILGRTAEGHQIDWIGDPHKNIYAVLIAVLWRHAGYIMVLYLAGLKGVDPSLREAASIDGANEWKTFWRVVFPAMKPVNIVVLVVTVIESLRAFDLVYIINKGRNGLELLSVLVTDNIIGEASRIGYGSALGVLLLLISMIFIIVYLVNVFREQQQ